MPSIKHNLALPKYQPYVWPDSKSISITKNNKNDSANSSHLPKSKFTPDTINLSPMKIVAGPMLRYIGLTDDLTRWLGSVLVVTDDEQPGIVGSRVNEVNAGPSISEDMEPVKDRFFLPVLTYTLSVQSKSNSKSNSNDKHNNEKCVDKNDKFNYENEKISSAFEKPVSDEQKFIYQLSIISKSADQPQEFQKDITYTQNPDWTSDSKKSEDHHHILKASDFSFGENENSDDNNDYRHDLFKFPKGFTIGELLLKEYGKSFWKFSLCLPMDSKHETRVDYSINNMNSSQNTFYIIGSSQNARAVFYSCNGFSSKVDTSLYNGSLWNDVLRHHKYQQSVYNKLDKKGSRDIDNKAYCTDSNSNDHDKDDETEPTEGSNHYHVLLGGGDQLYCDRFFYTEESMASWIEIFSVEKKLSQPWTDSMKKQVDKQFLDIYMSWFGQGKWTGGFIENNNLYDPYFPKVLASIPSINIWDDHDIMDGYGSYADTTMRSPIIEGIGNLGYKYYMLFQQHNLPNDCCSTEPHWICQNVNDPEVKPKFGPYITNISRSIYSRLGKDIAFVGIDCRTERSMSQVVYPESYDLIFKRLRKELGLKKGLFGVDESIAKNTNKVDEDWNNDYNSEKDDNVNAQFEFPGWPWFKIPPSLKNPCEDTKIKHLYVMLGVPVAFPRLTLVEDIARSNMITPVRLLANYGRIRTIRRMTQGRFSERQKKNDNVNEGLTGLIYKAEGMMGSLVNNFDNQLDVLDDITDRWTCKLHEEERNYLITELQNLAKEANTRITILSGDIHMAGIGRFYSPSSNSIEKQSSFEVSKSDWELNKNPNIFQKGYDYYNWLTKKPQRSDDRPFNNLDSMANPTTDYRLMINVISSGITNAPPDEYVVPSTLLISSKLSSYFLDKVSKANAFEKERMEKNRKAKNALIPDFLICWLSYFFPKHSWLWDWLVNNNLIEYGANHFRDGPKQSYEKGRVFDRIRRPHIVKILKSKLVIAFASRVTVKPIDNMTGEDMINLFKVDVDGSRRLNQVFLPRRNWASLVVIDRNENEEKNHISTKSMNQKSGCQVSIKKSKMQIASHEEFPCRHTAISNKAFSKISNATLGVSKRDVRSKVVVTRLPMFGIKTKLQPSKIVGKLVERNEISFETNRYENSFSEYPRYPDDPGAVSVVLHVEKSRLNSTGETRPYEIIIPKLKI